jgi:hypothetical protein
VHSGMPPPHMLYVWSGVRNLEFGDSKREVSWQSGGDGADYNS